MINRKGQEEIVGFVLIVVIIAIIMLVFLVIMIRNDDSSFYRDSREVNEFLESSMQYTSDCAISYEPDYSTVGELLRECNSGNNCLSGKSACEVLNSSVSEMIEASWKIGEDRSIKGFIFNSTYYVNSSSNTGEREVLYLSKGNCSGSYVGGEDISPDYPGSIISRLLLCF